MTSFYQIDCSLASSGKRVAATKRRVRWRYGTVNEDAVAAGVSGTECRGTEHEVTLVWSITSGKRLVLLDGNEVHFSTGRRTESKFQCSWTATALGNDVLTIIAHAAAPLRSTPGFKQFDLVINGQSYSDMPHIYELGMQVDCMRNNKLTAAINTQHNAVNVQVTREKEWQWAQRVTKLEQEREMDWPGPTPPMRSHSLPIEAQRGMDRITPPRSNSFPFVNDLLSEKSAIANNGDLLSASLPLGVTYDDASSVDEFVPSQPPSYETIWSSIMDAYDSSNVNQINALSQFGAAENGPKRNGENSSANTITPDPTIHQIKAENTCNSDGSFQTQARGIQGNNETLQISDNNISNLQVKTKEIHNKIGVTSPRDVSEIDGAMTKLVNFDDLLSPVLNMKLTMDSDNEKENGTNRSSNSRGIPPKIGSKRFFGRQLTLYELQNQQRDRKSVV